MNYVKHLNIFGVEAKEIPCINGTGAPTDTTEGSVGCLYMDVDTGEIYKCIAVENNIRTWVSAEGNIGDIESALDEIIAIQNALIGDVV